MDPTRLLLFIAFLGSLVNIGLYATTDRSIENPLTLQEIEADAGFIQLATSETHACGLGAAGRVWCWGNGEAGQLGHGLFASSETPVPVNTLPGPAIGIDVKGNTSCAVLESGTTWCWGRSTSGQIGLPFATPAIAYPVSIGAQPAHLVSAGDTSICTSLREGGISCWGDMLSQDEDGRIFMTNPGIYTDYNTKDYYQVLDSGEFHHCGLTLQGKVSCWGDTTKGQAGLNTTPFTKRAILNTTQDIQTENPIAMLSAGYDHTCAIDTQNTLLCWGDKRAYSPDPGNSFTPITVAKLETPIALAAGNDTTCFIDKPYTYCLGNDETSPWLAFPPSLPEMIQIDAAGKTLCGLDNSGGAWCSHDKTISQAGLRPTDWVADNSLQARWERVVGWWAKEITDEQAKKLPNPIHIP